VVRCPHSQSTGYGISDLGTRTAPPPHPATITVLVEGGTLAYRVTVTDRAERPDVRRYASGPRALRLRSEVVAPRHLEADHPLSRPPPRMGRGFTVRIRSRTECGGFCRLG
jgi:hypothetical protein